MQLLLGDDHLVGIAVEGLDPDDQTRATPETVEVADLTLYYGKGTGFEYADGVDVVQFKYSPSQENAAFRTSDAKKTIAKFAESYRNYEKLYGAQEVEKKLRFQLVTNRPIYPQFTQAIRALATGKSPSGEVRKQARQFTVAAGLKGEALAAFAGKCQFLGESSSLILLVLQRYEKGSPLHATAKFTHTIAVIRVTKSLDVKYYRGRVNHLFVSKS